MHCLFYNFTCISLREREGELAILKLENEYVGFKKDGSWNIHKETLFTEIKSP